MKIMDRIKDFRRVPASELRPNPKNWRIHPDGQKEGLRTVLAEIGMVDAVIARELPDGGLELVDGHLRTETVTDTPIPCLILDITEEESLKDFDLAYAYECKARAFASLGDSEKMNSYFVRAKDFGEQIEIEEDRKIFFNDLYKDPWYECLK